MDINELKKLYKEQDPIWRGIVDAMHHLEANRTWSGMSWKWTNPHARRAYKELEHVRDRYFTNDGRRDETQKSEKNVDEGD
jgi:hypothetical protein